MIVLTHSNEWEKVKVFVMNAKLVDLMISAVVMC